MTVFEEICKAVGMSVIGEDLARRAVLELLPCIKRSESYAKRNPRAVAAEITAYLDDVVRNP